MTPGYSSAAVTGGGGEEEGGGGGGAAADSSLFVHCRIKPERREIDFNNLDDL